MFTNTVKTAHVDSRPLKNFIPKDVEGQTGKV